ncbi:hypothetical protein SAMN04488688_103559 [Paenibacillus sp. cl141a]|nr:hypothetical protein [Paenibacillus sp. cl141a]SEL35092.1 hypothetical protein SAMN04488688_103559 [Paenibacillus sp. cl141a]
MKAQKAVIYFTIALVPLFIIFTVLGGLPKRRKAVRSSEASNG